MRKRAETMTLEFLVALVLTVIVIFGIGIPLGKVFMSTKKTESAFYTLADTINSARTKYTEDKTQEVPVQLGKEMFLAFFNKDAAEIFIEQAVTDPCPGDVDYILHSDYYVARPTDCAQDQPCMCVCTDAEIADDTKPKGAVREEQFCAGTKDDVGGTLMEVRTHSAPIVYRSISCDVWICKNMDPSTKGVCGKDGSSQTLCEGGMFLDRALTLEGKISAHIKSIVLHKSQGTLFVKRTLEGP